MAIVVQGTLPKELILAYSGGPDSGAALRYLIYKGFRNVKCVFFHHGDSSSDSALVCVKKCINTININYLSHFKYAKPITLDIGHIHEYESKYKNISVSSSQEDYWRTYRYIFFKEIQEKYKLNIVTAHTLDDCVEEWIINSIVRGRPGVIKYNGPCSVIRPFRLNTKEQMTDYLNQNWESKYKIGYNSELCEDHDNFSYHVDPENINERHLRVYIRKNFKFILDINPGIYSMIRRKMVKEMTNILSEDDINILVNDKLVEIYESK